MNAHTGSVSLTTAGSNRLLTIGSGGSVSATGSGGIVYQADNMTLTGTTNATGTTVILRPDSTGQLINLGGADASGALGLTNTELNTITAGTLNIGQSGSGAISVTAAISSPAATLNLVNGSGGISENSSGGLIATNLSIGTSGTVSLTTQNNNVGTLAAIINGSGTNSFSFTNKPGIETVLTIGSVNGIDGINTSAGNGAIALSSLNGQLFLNQTVNAGTGDVSLASNDQILQNNGIIGIRDGSILRRYIFG